MRRKTSSTVLATLVTLAVVGRFGGREALAGSASVPSAEAGERGFPQLSEESTVVDYVRYAALNNPALEAAFNRWRAALEKVLKKHYGKGEWDDPTLKLKLGEIIVLASQRYHFIQEGKLGKLTRSANTILHNYSKRERMSDQDDRTILEFLKTVKFLIQRAPN